VGGIFSAIRSINTEKANNTVNPKVTFSPDSGGNKNPVKVNIDNNTHGIMTYAIINMILINFRGNQKKNNPEKLTT
jgi:hypothetical protein